MEETKFKEPGRAWPTKGLFLCLLAAVAMSYGWRYRGTVGHEGGAMVPGALLGLAVCLASGRPDWYRRAAVAGLFGAVGWAWGGSLSYMEHNSYIESGSFSDVLYGCAAFFFLGGLWAGIGGAVLGLALTLSRSHLQRLVGPFITMSAAFLATYLCLLFQPAWRDLLDRYTMEHFHDADWYPALTVIVVCGLHALVRPKEWEEAGLFLAGGVAWMIGYLGFTKFGGLSLAPPYRSEGWGGVVGILVVLLIYLVRQRNRAALMLSLYGLIGGGLAFVFSYVVVRSRAEETVGLLMGLGLGLGVLRLARGGLETAHEDVPTRRLDVFAVFVMLVAMMWINLRRGPMAWIHRSHFLPDKPVGGLMPWVWLVLAGIALSALVVYALYLYGRGRLALIPGDAYGKGALVIVLLIWITFTGCFTHELPTMGGGFPLGQSGVFISAVIATALVLARPGARSTASASGTINVPPSDPCWRVGRKYGLVWMSVPILLVAFAALSVAKHAGTSEYSRKRFGPDAYWRKITQVVGKWELVGLASEIGGAPAGAAKDAPEVLEIRNDRSVVVSLSGGQTLADTHTWQHMNSVIWLEWYGRKADQPQRASLPMKLRNEGLYILWPREDSRSYLVYKKMGK